MGKWNDTNPLARLAGDYVAAAIPVTAGGTGDATEVNGAFINCTGVSSLSVLVPFTATLAAGETLSLAANLQDASDLAGTGAADYGTAAAATVVATGGVGGTTETGMATFEVDITGADNFVRVQLTPSMSAANTDTAALQTAAIKGAFRHNPPTQANFTRL
jgi:hypothetical protein